MTRAVAAAAVAVLFRASLSAEPFDWRKTLDQPLSPGNVAALVEHGHEPEVQQRWRQALSDEAPAVRAAAARAIYAARADALGADVIKALSTETDARAAEEQLRASFLLGAAPEADLVLSVLERTRPGPDFLAEMLGRALRIQALEPRPEVAKLDPKGYLRSGLLVAAVHRWGGVPLTRIASAVLRRDDPKDWSAVWALARSGYHLDDGVIAGSLMSPNARLREITFWNLASDPDKARALPPIVADTLASTPEARPPDGEPDAARDESALFAFELLQRARGAKPTEGLAFLKDACREGFWRFPVRPHDVASLLTEAERKLLVKNKSLSEDRLLGASAVRGGAPDPRSQSRTLSALTDFPKGYVTGLATLVGCHPREQTFASASITFDEQGRPGPLPPRPAAPEPCESLARVLFASSYLPYLAETSATIRVALGGEHLDCVANQEATPEGGSEGANVRPGTPVRVAGAITEPRKIRHVRPEYPLMARQRRVQGLVILEAVIDPCGLVSDIILLRGVTPELNEAAANAVAQWRYTPTLLDGVPVPVIMTVTVTFSL